MPRIVFLFDEFGDLWDSAPSKAERDKLENPIIRLGQKARAAGIHLIVFTQRPKKVVTPRLRANCPVRVLMTVADADDSESITGNKSVDGSQLIGRGDLFFNGDRLQSLLPDESDFAKLLIADSADNADIPQNQPQLSANQQSAQIADIQSLSQSAPADKLSANQQLSAPLSAIIDYARKKDEWISARQVQAGIAIFKTAKADEIRSYFQWLADKGYGVVRGDVDNLEFSVG